MIAISEMAGCSTHVVQGQKNFCPMRMHGTIHVLVTDDEAKVQIIGATILSANYMYARTYVSTVYICSQYFDTAGSATGRAYAG